MTTPFAYTDRDFVSFRNQFVEFLKDRVPGWSADPSDFAYELIEGMSYIGDMMSYYVDRAAQESNILSANSVKNVHALARLFGYNPGLATSARCQVEMVNNSIEDVVIAQGTRVGAESGGLGYEILTDITLEPGKPHVTEVWEGTSYQEELGVSDGTGNQKFFLTSKLVDGRLGALSIMTQNPDNGNREYWSPTEIIIDSAPGEYVFSAYIDPDGTTYVSFGDGVAGRVPPKGWTISALYRETAGYRGNAPGSQLTRFLVSWDNESLSKYSDVSLRSLESPSGGRDVESLDSIRSGTVALAKTQRRAVTAGDYEALAISDSRIRDALCETAIWSRPIVWVLPQEQKVLGNIDNAKQLEDYIESRLKNAALAGVQPTVRIGPVKYTNVDVSVMCAPSVDVNYVVNEVKRVLFERFSYDNAVFAEPVGVDHIIRAIHTAIPMTIVQMVKSVKFSYEAILVNEVVVKPHEAVAIPSIDAIDVVVTKNTASGRTRF